MITISWAGALALTLIVATIGYIVGASRVTTWHREDISWSIGEQRKLATALRDLYEATGFEWPDLDVAEPPQPTRWQQVKARVAQRFRPTPADVPTEPAADLELDSGDPSPVAGTDPAPDTDPHGFPPPTGEPTRPDLKQAAQVPPPALLTDDDWAATRDRMYADMLAEIRGGKPR